MEKHHAVINFKRCIVCQCIKEEELVENPSSHKKLVAAIKERASYGDLRYSEVWSSLEKLSPQELELKQTSWHRRCYQDATHTGMLKRAKERYERELADPDESRRKSCNAKESEAIYQLTRSKTTPYNRDVCFFCEGTAGYRETLRTVSTMSAGQSLHDAIELSGNDKLRVKLSTAVNVTDAHAIDIKYHKKMLGKQCIKCTPQAYSCDQTYSRKMLKQLIQSDISGVKFHKPKRVNESERVKIKETRDAAIQLSEDVRDMRDDMKTLYDAALLLRKAINRSTKWVFDGSLDTISKDNFPEEMYCFYRWVINGPNTTLSADEKCAEGHKRAMSLVQSTASMCLTERQIGNKKSCSNQLGKCHNN